MEKFNKIKNDSMFKAIFTKEENRDLLERLIYECTNLRVKVISTEATELKKDNASNKKKILDVLVRTNDEEINIEVNSYENIALRRRNASYIFKRYADGVYMGETYNDMLKYIQINLTSNLSLKEDLITKYTLRSENNKEFIDNLEIYEVNLQKAKKLCYNNNELSVIGMLEMDEEHLRILKGDKLMEKLKKEVKQYFSTIEPFLPPEVEERLLINTLKEDARNDGLREGREQGIKEGKEEGLRQGIEEGIKEGIKEGREEGIEQNTKDIAKKMLEEQFDDDLIIKITGINKEELESLKTND